MKKKTGKSVSLFSGKGGVGKTITTLNLAGIYETLGKKVLIMDLDLSGGNISLCLNTPTNKTIYNFVDDYNNNRFHNFLDYVTKYDDHIDILACPKDPRQASKIDSKYIEIAIDKAEYLYDIVLIDTNHILNELNLVILDAVTEILLLSIFRDLNKDNYKILLNNSRDPFKKYFTMFDIKNILKENVNYEISSEFYIKNIDTYIMNGSIITLDKKASGTFNKDYTTMTRLAVDLISVEKRVINEEN